jgi:hypothetical protein
MRVTKKHLMLLATHGFKWYKDGGTDRVDPADIQRIEATEGGLTVHYTDQCALASTTAKVRRIEVPEDPRKTWIFVHFDELEERRRVRRPRGRR